MRETAPRPVGTVATITGRKITPRDLQLASLAIRAMDEFAEDTRAGGGAMPGEFPEWDRLAWIRFERELEPCTCTELTPYAAFDPDGLKVDCPCNWMLMHHISETRAAFKNRTTRNYRYA